MCALAIPGLPCQSTASAPSAPGTGAQMPDVDPMSSAFVFGLPELKAVLLATAIIATIAAMRYGARRSRVSSSRS